MSYYQFNKQEILQRAKERYSKEKAAKYYLKNKKAIKGKSNNLYKNLSIEEKDKIKEYQRKDISNWFRTKNKHYKVHDLLFLLSTRISEKTLKFDKIVVNKKEFYKFKQPNDLDLKNVDQIVISDKFKHSVDSFRYFVGYKKDEIVKPLCIIHKFV